MLVDRRPSALPAGWLPLGEQHPIDLTGAVTEGFLSVFDQLSSLAAAPRLLTAAAVCTLVLSLGYLLCLRFFAPWSPQRG